MYDKKYFKLIITLAILIFVLQLFMNGFNSIKFFMILRKISILGIDLLHSPNYDLIICSSFIYKIR